MKKVLLDTNGYSALFKGEEKILETIGSADIVFISVIVLGELYGGFRGGSKESENRKRVNAFLSRPTVRILQVTKETAEIFGTIKYQLKSAGTPIPLNDVWIAAQAIESGAILVTYDSHFSKVPGIRLWEP